MFKNMKSTVMHHFTNLSSSMMSIFTPTQLRFIVNTVNIKRDERGTSIKELQLETEI